MTKLHFEFPVTLKPVRHRKRATDTTGPVCHHLAEVLILGYQIEERIEQDWAKDYSEIAAHLGLTRARTAQIAGLLLLAPEIQQQVLEASPDNLEQVTEHDLRSISSKPKWSSQLSLWKGLNSLHL